MKPGRLTHTLAAAASAIALAAIAAPAADFHDVAQQLAVHGVVFDEHGELAAALDVSSCRADLTDGFSRLIATTVTDATGSGSGWNLTITSTQFTTGGGSPHTLSTSASSLTGVTNSCVGGATCTSPTNSIGYPVAVPAGSTPPAAVKYFNAAANTGQGQFTNTPSVSVSVPANTYAGSYTSTLTLAAVSGP